MESSGRGPSKVSVYDAVTSLLLKVPPGTEVSIKVKFNQTPESSSSGLVMPISPNVRSSRTSLTSVRTWFSTTDLNPTYVEMYLSVRCVVHYTDEKDKKHSQTIQEEWSSDTSLGDLLKAVVQRVRHKPLNGEFRGILYTGTFKENLVSPIPLNRESCERKTIGKLSKGEDKCLRFHFDCNESIEMNDATKQDDNIWRFKV